MVIRSRKRDGHKFWGCQNYPKCKHTEEIEAPDRPDVSMGWFAKDDELCYWDPYT